MALCWLFVCVRCLGFGSLVSVVCGASVASVAVVCWCVWLWCVVWFGVALAVWWLCWQVFIIFRNGYFLAVYLVGIFVFQNYKFLAVHGKIIIFQNSIFWYGLYRKFLFFKMGKSWWISGGLYKKFLFFKI